MGVLYDVAVEGKDLKPEKQLETVGVYTISNSLAISVHEIDYTDDRVLASGNGDNPKWYDMTEQHNEDTDEWEQGFMFGSFFVPFSEVMSVSALLNPMQCSPTILMPGFMKRRPQEPLTRRAETLAATRAVCAWWSRRSVTTSARLPMVRKYPGVTVMRQTQRGRLELLHRTRRAITAAWLLSDRSLWLSRRISGRKSATLGISPGHCRGTLFMEVFHYEFRRL